MPDRDMDVLTDVLEETAVGTGWSVILFNDEIHTFDDVIRQVIKAIGCSKSHAEEMAWRVHSRGNAVVILSSLEKCLQVQSVLQEIQLITEIRG